MRTGDSVLSVADVRCPTFIVSLGGELSDDLFVFALSHFFDCCVRPVVLYATGLTFLNTDLVKEFIVDPVSFSWRSRTICNFA